MFQYSRTYRQDHAHEVHRFAALNDGFAIRQHLPHHVLLQQLVQHVGTNDLVIELGDLCAAWRLYVRVQLFVICHTRMTYNMCI